MITKDFLQEHFRKHDTLTLYKPDGTPVTFSRQFCLVLNGGHQHLEFKDYDAFLAFYGKHRLRLTPAAIVG